VDVAKRQFALRFSLSSLVGRTLTVTFPFLPGLRRTLFSSISFFFPFPFFFDERSEQPVPGPRPFETPLLPLLQPARTLPPFPPLLFASQFLPPPPSSLVFLLAIGLRSFLFPCSSPFRRQMVGEPSIILFFLVHPSPVSRFFILSDALVKVADNSRSERGGGHPRGRGFGFCCLGMFWFVWGPGGLSGAFEFSPFFFDCLRPPNSAGRTARPFVRQSSNAWGICMHLSVRLSPWSLTFSNRSWAPPKPASPAPLWPLHEAGYKGRAPNHALLPLNPSPFLCFPLACLSDLLLSFPANMKNKLSEHFF